MMAVQGLSMKREVLGKRKNSLRRKKVKWAGRGRHALPGMPVKLSENCPHAWLKEGRNAFALPMR